MWEQHEKLLTEQKQAQASLKHELESLQSHLSNADKEIRNQKHVISHLEKKASYCQNNHLVLTNDADAMGSKVLCREAALIDIKERYNHTVA